MDRSILNNRMRDQGLGSRWTTKAVLMLTALVLTGLAGCLEDGEPVTNGDRDPSLEPLDEELTLYANADGRTSNPYPYLNPAPRGGLAAVADSAGPMQEGLTWSFPMDPPLESALALDPGSPAQAVIYLEGRLGPGIEDADGNILAPGAGTVTVFPRISSGGETVAEGYPRDVVVLHAQWKAPDEPYPKEDWTLDLQKDMIQAGEELVWEVHVASATPSMVLLLGTGEARGHSHIVLPIATTQNAPEGGGTG